MHKKLIIPIGWACTLEEAPPGPFIPLGYPDQLCFKSEYHHDDQQRVMAFNSAGEFFVGEGNKEIVQPVEMIVEDE